MRGTDYAHDSCRQVIHGSPCPSSPAVARFCKALGYVLADLPFDLRSQHVIPFTNDWDELRSELRGALRQIFG